MSKQWLYFAVLLLLVASLTYAQVPRSVTPTSPAMAYGSLNPMPGSSNAAPTQLDRHIQEQMNRDRQLALKRDTDKLLEMATSLKQSVDQTNAGILSMDVIKRAQEIEKLAKSVREKMKGN
jgi:hypothetical protein